MKTMTVVKKMPMSFLGLRWTRIITQKIDIPVPDHAKHYHFWRGTKEGNPNARVHLSPFWKAMSLRDRNDVPYQGVVYECGACGNDENPQPNLVHTCRGCRLKVFVVREDWFNGIKWELDVITNLYAWREKNKIDNLSDKAA